MKFILFILIISFCIILYKNEKLIIKKKLIKGEKIGFSILFFSKSLDSFFLILNEIRIKRKYIKLEKNPRYSYAMLILEEHM